MKILIYGAGVLGSLYAAQLQNSGHEVTVLARGQRLADLKEHGIVLEEFETGQRSYARVAVIEHLDPQEKFDFVLVLVRKNQIKSVLPELAASKGTPNVVFMVNNAAGSQAMVDALGLERVLLGFPGAGGERVGHIVRYHIVSDRTQPTTLGELDGSITPRLQNIGAALEAAGYPVAYCDNMDAWLKTHVALVSPIANALYTAGGNNYRLAKTRDGVVLMVRAIREGLKVLRTLGYPILPVQYRFAQYLPEPLLVAVMQRSLNSRRAELVMARHANAARDEMQMLADEFQELARAADIPTPHLNHLYASLDPKAPAIPEGSDNLPMNWNGIGAMVAVMAGLLVGLLVWSRRRSVKRHNACCDCCDSEANHTCC